MRWGGMLWEGMASQGCVHPSDSKEAGMERAAGEPHSILK